VAVPAGGVGFTIVPAESEARFAARELLAANTVQNDAIGKTKDVMGSIVLDSEGKVVPGSKIVVNIQTLQSDRDQRDGFIKQSVLQTRQFPTAEFAPTEIQGLAWPAPTSGEATFKVLGDLTVHGVTKPATWDVTATFGAQDISGSASTVVTLPDFGMTKPRVPVVAEIEDNIKLEIDFKATRSN
jgi:polyisoprenoid-binding protein YceI